MIRSIVGIVVGYMVFVAATVGLWSAFGYGADEIPSEGFYLFSLILEMLFALCSGYLAALIAGRRAGLHATILAVFFVLVGVASLFASPDRGPWWVPWSTILILAPCVGLGGVLRGRRLIRSA